MTKPAVKSFVYGLISLFFFTVVSTAKVKITDKIALDAEFRPRLEFDDRDFSDKTGYDSYSTFRTRLGVELNGFIENTSLYLMIGDSRLMGFTNPYLTGKPVGPNRFDNNLGVIMAFIEARNIFTENLYLKIGRMSNDQGRAYLIGPGNWNIFGPRTFDGMKAGYRNGRISWNLWHFFGAAGDRHWYPAADNPLKYPNPSIDYKRDHTLTGLDVSVCERKVNFLTYLDLDQKPVADAAHGGSNAASSRYTAAVNLDLGGIERSKRWLDFDAAYQFGTEGHSSGRGNISAYMFAGDYGMMLYKPLKVFGGAGFHILSGDDSLNMDRITYFYDNYCSKHRVFGHMDYFTGLDSERSLGLQDLILRGGFSPLEGLACMLDLHHFSVQKPIKSAVDGKDAYNLGFELDTTVKYTIRKGLTAELGLDFFIPAEDWQGEDGDTSTFVYMALTAKI